MQPNPTVEIAKGVKMPMIALGTMNIRNNDKSFNLQDLVLKALETGYRHFDSWTLFENQTALGDALKTALSLKREVLEQKYDENGLPTEEVKTQVNTYRREDIFITLKVLNLKNEPIAKQIDHQLKELKLGYADLVLLNYSFSPPVEKDAEEEGGPKTLELNHRSLKDVWGQMEKALEQGLCRAIGISNFTCQAMINLLQFAKVRPAVVQLESNPYCLQDDLINFIKKFGMHVQAYSPLCRGGKDQKLLFGEKNDIFGEISLKELAEKYMKSVAQVILNWNLCRGVSFVVKTDKYERLAVNWDITNFELQEEDRYVVSGLDKSQRSFNPKMHPFWKGIDPLA